MANVLLFAHSASHAVGRFDLVLTGALALFGVAALLAELYALAHALASRSWPSEEAEVIAARIDERRGARGRVYFTPVVSYRYWRDGREVVAHRAAFGNLSVGDRAEAERFIAQFTIGARCPARVHATRPTLAVLIPGPNRMIWSRLLFFSVFAGFSTYAFANVVTLILRK